MATPALPNPSPLLDDPLPPEPKPRRETKVWKPKMRDPDTREPPAAAAAQDPEAQDNEEAEEPEPEQDEGPEPPPLLPTDAIEPTPSSAEEDGDDDSSSVSSASSAAAPDASVAAAGGKTERPFPAATDLLHISYNQDYGCFAAGTKTGFRIYNCDPFREIFRRDLGPSPAAAATPADQDAGPLTAK